MGKGVTTMVNADQTTKTPQKAKAFSTINARAFLTVVIILSLILFLCSLLSYVVPQGSYERDADGSIIMGTYREQGIEGVSFGKVVTAPLRVFISSDSVTIIMISVFLLIMSGVFNIVEKTGGIEIFIVRIMNRLRDKGGPVVCITVLIFMLFGSLFGMFEELVTLLPLIIVFMLSMNMDTMVGLGACLLASCFGFSAAIANPFSIGIASQYAGVHPSEGTWLRIVFFAIVYVIVCTFLMQYLKKIERDPASSPTYESDLIRRAELTEDTADHYDKDHELVFKVYLGFFALQGLILISIASVRAISGLAIPILAASFLIFGIVSGLVVSRKPKNVARYFFSGAGAMLPAVILIAIASSVKLVMEESGIIDTIMHFVLQVLDGKSKIVAVILIYFLILFLQLFIGSATAKIILVMPIIIPIAAALDISPTLVILTYCMADGFTDVIMPTNPVLLIGLSMANVSYVKWVKWTWKLQLLVFTVSVLVLFFGVSVGY